MKINPSLLKDIRQIRQYYSSWAKICRGDYEFLKQRNYSIWKMGFMQFSEQMTNTKEIFSKIEEICRED